MLRRSTSLLACSTSSTGLVAALAHPATLNAMDFRSDEWAHAMLNLYRQVLKSHQIYLANEQQRELGDKFVKAEFHRHKGANVKYASIFYKGWADYVAQLEGGVTQRDLTKEEAEMLNDEQKGRLTDLRRHVVEIKSQNGDFPTGSMQ